MFAEYATEIGKLMNKLLCLMSQSLGLEKGYLHKRLGDNPTLEAHSNHYPPCPDPELTMGLPVHTDFRRVITILKQSGANGLQVMTKDGKWVTVDPLSNAFIINIGDQLQV